VIIPSSYPQTPFVEKYFPTSKRQGLEIEGVDLHDTVLTDIRTSSRAPAKMTTASIVKARKTAIPDSGVTEKSKKTKGKSILASPLWKSTFQGLALEIGASDLFDMLLTYIRTSGRRSSKGGCDHYRKGDEDGCARQWCNKED
jgi:hypothetical protein